VRLAGLAAAVALVLGGCGYAEDEAGAGSPRKAFELFVTAVKEATRPARSPLFSFARTKRGSSSPRASTCFTGSPPRSAQSVPPNPRIDFEVNAPGQAGEAGGPAVD
jgi:hypothetical protein